MSLPSFESIYGQPALWKSLKQGFENGSAVHAFLFVGDRGSGKRTAALVCAAAVLCEGADKPCGACKACKQVFGGVHPDLVRLGAEGASSIGIAAVRSLQETMRTKPYEAKCRAILLEDAQLLTQDAQNALLKTLEEPQEGNVLFLLCTQLEGLLPTVQSRCRLIRMGRLSKEEMRRGLADRGVPPERAEELFAASGGNLGRALEMHADPEYARMAERCVGLLEGLRAPEELPAALDSLKDMEKDRQLRRAFLEAMELLCQRLLRRSLGLPDCGGSALPRRDFTSESIHSMMDAIVWARKRLNANISWAAAVEPLLKRIIGG